MRVVVGGFGPRGPAPSQAPDIRMAYFVGFVLGFSPEGCCCCFCLLTSNSVARPVFLYESAPFAEFF